MMQRKKHNSHGYTCIINVKTYGFMDTPCIIMINWSDLDV